MSNLAKKFECEADREAAEQGEQPAQELDRGIPSINRNRPAGLHRGIFAVSLVGALLGAGALAYFSYSKHAKGKEGQEIAKELQPSVPAKSFKLERHEPAPPPATPAPMLPQAPPEPVFGSGSGGEGAGLGTAASPTSASPQRPSFNPRYAAPPSSIDKGSSSLMVASSSPSPATTASTQAPAAAAAPAQGSLGALLKPSAMKGNAATVLTNRDYLLTKGTYIDCALQTKINSTVAGMTMCIVTTSVYGDTGKILLVERGSQITGEYQSGMTQGQSRIFVVWNRIKTPNGVVVEIDSPGTDALGASGVEGAIDSHLSERFGGALMLSLIQDITSAVGNAVGNALSNGGSGLTLNNTTTSVQNMATEALKNTINIAPSLVKNQGDRVGILIARDLDFSTVYGTRADEPAE